MSIGTTAIVKRALYDYFGRARFFIIFRVAIRLLFRIL